MSIPTTTIYSREEFRKWLHKHHKNADKMSVILFKKHTGKTAPTHREMIEEAICFGWIDTTIKRLDEDRFMRHFSKRNKNSKWSRNTISYAKQLIKDGKMSEQGIVFYKLGLAKPTHDHGIPDNPNMPRELKEALLKEKDVHKKFVKLSPSARKTFYRWIIRGKQKETRAKRISHIIKGLKR